MADASDDPVEALFHQAVEQPFEERAAFLDSACNGNAALRADVESLLAYDEAEPTRSIQPRHAQSPTIANAPATHGQPLPLPSWVGRYRIVRRLGEGGMGIVYEAEQENPRRPVALKVVRQGLVSPDDLLRFDREAQILGRLHHPGIAEIYEAGIADDGRPYFAMELVRGARLDEYARDCLPDCHERLKLFARVCDAVQHAHDGGIVHRDLKPGNILVDVAGQPKVLDFGVARAQDAEWQSTGGRTLTGQLLGTPQYMSPEQIAEDPRAVDARSDVYSLGLILFELLANQRPYQVEGVPLPDVVRVIREYEPVQLGTLNRNFRGDAETIVAKAIDKERSRRYASAGELAADVRRFLAGDPIHARRINSLQRLGRWVKRNRPLAAALAGLAVTLACVTIGSLFAAGQFREMAHEQTELAASEGTQRRHAQEAEDAARASLYAAEMNLAARVAEAPTGLARLRELVAHWEHAGEGRIDPRGWEWRLFRNLSQPERLILADRDFYAVAWSPDGARLAASVAGEIEIRDSVDGDVRLRIPVAGNAESLQWSTDGRRLAIGYQPGGLGVYDAETGASVYQATHGGASTTVCLSPDGRLLASHSDDTVVRVHDIAAKKVIASLPGAVDSIPSEFGFSPNGRRLAVYQLVDSRRAVGIWDTADWTLVRTIAGPPDDWFTSIAWADDRRLLLPAERNGTVVWDIEANKAVRSLPADSHLMVSVDSVHGGQVVAAGDWGRLVWVWNADTGERIAICRGHTERIFRVALAPDGSAVAAVARDGAKSALRVWGLTGARPVRTIEPAQAGPVEIDAGLAWRPDGLQLAGAMGKSQTNIYDLGANTTAARDGHQFVWDRTGTRAVATRGEEVLVYDARGTNPVQTLKVPGNVKAFAWSPVDDRLAIRAGLNLWIYDAAKSDSPRLVYEDPATRDRSSFNRCGGVAWRPDGRLIAFASPEPKGWSVRLINPHTPATVAMFDAMPLPVWDVTWSPDASRLAVAGDDAAIKIFDAATGQLLQSLRGHTFTVRDLAHSPDGTGLASAGLDGNVLLWDTVSGRLILTFELGAPVLGVAWSPDGAKLATLTETGAIRIWDAGRAE